MTPPHQEQRCGGRNRIQFPTVDDEGRPVQGEYDCPGCPDCNPSAFGPDRNELVPDLHIRSAEVAPNPPPSEEGYRCDPEDGVAEDHHPHTEVVPASTLQSLTAERDEAIKRAEQPPPNADYVPSMQCPYCPDEPCLNPDHLSQQATYWNAVAGQQMDRVESAEQKLTQLQAAHRADLERVAGELEEAKRCLDTAMHKGSLRVRGEIAEKFVRGAKNHVVLAIQSLSTKATD